MGSLFEKEDVKTSASSTNELYQQDYFDKLLEGAEGWLDSGGMGSYNNLYGDMSDTLKEQAKYYQNILSGEVDQTALNNALTSQADMAQQNLERNILPSISQSANAAGGLGGSRQGIAEGLAASDMSAQLQNQQAQTINQFQQQGIQNQMNAANALSNTFNQLGALDSLYAANASGAKDLQNLMAYQQLISGNMGGTQTSENTAHNAGGSMFDSILGGASTAAGMFGAFSDKKLKKKIKKVKTKGGKPVKTNDGIDVAEWEWNDKAKKLGLKGKARGVIADEAEKKRPDAVAKDPKTGYKKVNYGAIM